jgi:DNA recombination protein RmuC
MVAWDALATQGTVFASVVLLAALVIGGTIAYRIFAVPARVRATTAEVDRDTQAELGRRLAVEKAEASAAAQRVPSLEAKIDDLQRRLAVADAERASNAARVDELRKFGEELETKFAGLATKALTGSSAEFLRLADEQFKKHKLGAEGDLSLRQKAIDDLIKPIQQNLAKFDEQLTELEKVRIGAYAAVTEQVKGLVDAQKGLRSETARLVQALHQPRFRGRWGEIHLRKALEMVGMTQHVDFREQATVATEDSRLRPDVVIDLPGSRKIVVDAKTPLDAYLAAMEAPDESTRNSRLVEHGKKLREHVRALSDREYWSVLTEFLIQAD